MMHFMEIKPDERATDITADRFAGSQALQAEDEAYLVFRVGQEIYGTPLLAVREVVEFKPPKPLPNTKGYFLGVINIRGEIVGVIDLSERLGSGKISGDRRTFIVVNAAHGAIAATVDEVRSVQRIHQDQIDTQIRIHNQSSYFIGVARLGADLVTLMDLPQVVTEQDITTLNAISA
jgi:purine-binding chemotaxis protein CheW